ncbi:hypothetical protein EDC04DRAFT_2607179 [Pisolithus marmoratus]|nr:hypothetical protein EDC04DRAFT_2607179 [Pisolithus marmoratus]
MTYFVTLAGSLTSLSSDEDSAAAWERVLSKVSPKSCKQCKCTYDTLFQYAPGLEQPLNNHKKRGALCEVITEQFRECSYNATCLKAHVETYTVPHPLKEYFDDPVEYISPYIVICLKNSKEGGCLQTKSSDINGSFNYCMFYYNVVDMIEECLDKGWVDHLKRWSCFKNEFGNVTFRITATSMTINSTQSSPLASRITVTSMAITVHRESDIHSEPHDYALGSRLCMVSPVGSKQMLMMDDSDQFASKELPAMSSTWTNMMKASRKGKGHEVAFLGDEDKPSTV